MGPTLARWEVRNVRIVASHCTLRDLLGGSVFVDDGTAHNTIVDCDLSTLGLGTYSGAGSSDNLVEGNVMGHLGLANADRNVVRGNVVETTSRAIEINRSEDNLVTGNSLTFGYAGVYMDQSPGTVITDNDLSGTVYYGVWLASSPGCQVVGNRITGTVRLTGLRCAYSDDLLLADNELVLADGLGVHLVQCQRATLQGNTMDRGGVFLDAFVHARDFYDSHTLTANTVAGLPIRYHVDEPGLDVSGSAGQVLLVGCDGAIVHDVTIQDAWSAVQVEYCEGATIEDSALTGTRVAIWSRTSNDVHVRDNVLGSGGGAELWGARSVAVGNVVDAAGVGLRVQGPDAVVTHNAISVPTPFAGFGLIAGDAADGARIEDNVIAVCATGIALHDVSGAVLARNRVESCSTVGVALSGGDTTAVRVEANALVGCEVGLVVDGGAHANEVLGNTFAGNGTGVQVPEPTSGGNLFAGNDFANDQDAFDIAANAWDGGPTLGGNHWRSYAGVDADGDGVGDTPHPIPGGVNADALPSIDLRGPALLWPDAPSVSAQSGGVVGFDLYADASRAARPYVLAASLTGTEPGLPLAGGAVVPLVPDALTALILRNLDAPDLAGFAGVLDPAGGGTATWTLPPLDPGLVDTRVFLAYALLSPTDVASHPVTLVVDE